ncbi:MAG: glycine cleavage system aminomethyltransferase GcvT [Crocinitomicaceae bacterium]|nr:glycine cleavage system aminomethyltransferase GcvT [Crocinitomicaceae bacterium]MDG1777067.1 glycine cleavage system aminomethyltransferase GcvT [Crocinitomicaceae bacterium]
MKDTALSNKHIALGAKMVPFAGYNMPVQYEGVNSEHQTVREGVGVFDVSHMGEFFISGPGALDLIQKITSNDASTLTIGRAQYSCMPNGKGGIVDDLIIYKLKEEEYLLVVNASNIKKDWDWISSFNTYGAEMKDLSEDYSLLAIQGPKAIEAMQSLSSINLAEIKYYHFEVADFAGVDDVIISATGYTGSGGFEIYCKNENASQVWDKVFEAGAVCDIKPIGLAARDTLRLEMGFCLYGNDIDDTTSPLEAGLGWITKLAKDDFNDKAFLAKQKEEGTTRKLIAFEMIDRGIPRHNYPIVDTNGNTIGRVTSGTMSPSMKKSIGLGYVTKNLSAVDNEIFVEIRNKQVKAKIVKLPFYKKA